MTNQVITVLFLRLAACSFLFVFFLEVCELQFPVLTVASEFQTAYNGALRLTSDLLPLISPSPMPLKDTALDFLRLAASGQVQAAYDKYVHPAFIHHNPYFPGDRASLMKGMVESHVQFPQKVFEPIRAIEEGDLVAVHGRVRLTPDGEEIALIHIFRFSEGKIIEEWEAAQMPVDNSSNKNGFF